MHSFITKCFSSCSVLGQQDDPKDLITFEEAMDVLEDDSVPDNSPVPLTLKYDMGWQKRSSGRRYDSASGVGTMVGQETGKIVDYGIRSKDCRICTIWTRRNEIPPEHECFKNFSGSSRAMEADVAGEIVKRLEESGKVQVGILVMDEDSTTIARIRAELSRDITKWSDIMHVKKHLQAALYKLAAKHRCLTSDVIRYFLDKCFSYAITQNKGNAVDVEKALNNITPHAFGDHDSCGKWCRYEEDPGNYRHKYLPNGKNLQGDVLRKELALIFSDLATNAAKIAPCASTSVCESLNNMFASKAPKSRHLSASGSLNARVACAVSQKNGSHGYLGKVFSTGGLSPGEFYAKHASKIDHKRRYNNEYQNSKTYKRRKLNFGKAKSANQKANELREGKTYESNVDAGTKPKDIAVIPPPVSAPVYKPIVNGTQNIVFFDLETTSLAKDCDITQLAAVCGEKDFNRYVMPSQPIHSKATDVTHISVMDNQMYYFGNKVQIIQIEECLSLFLDWCQSIGNGPVILTAHNCRQFDAYRLMNHCHKLNLNDKVTSAIAGFADTLPMFTSLYKEEGWGNFKQSTIVQNILQQPYARDHMLHTMHWRMLECCKRLYKNRVQITRIFSHTVFSWQQ